jgi:hypothetical protein
VSFSTSLTYTVAEANNISKTVFVKFVPPVNKQNFNYNRQSLCRCCFIRYKHRSCNNT